MKSAPKLTAAFAVAVAMLLAGYVAHRSPPSDAASRAQVHGYTCPMHPQYRADHAGDCPICGMRLVAEADPGPVAIRDAPGAVRVSAGQRRLVGLRTDEVTRASLSHRLRVPGRVVIDEQRSYRLIAAVDGWIRELRANPADTFVRKDQVLASYYTPNLIAAAQTYVFALQTNAQAQTGDATIGYQRGTTALSLQQALDSLRSLGMSELQIREIERTRVAPAEVRVYAPASGFVVARGLSPGQRFDKGTELYRIADLDRVWVMADLFERDRRLVRPGARATVHYQELELPGRMADALPQFDVQSRTLKTRFELDNPDRVLRPDMFVDVELHVEVAAAIAVPADAVIDSGTRRIVYVERDEGVFEPRAIETGWRLGDRVEVTSGLAPGERVVVAGNFLVDSESRLRTGAAWSAEAAAHAGGPEQDPVCGMTVDPTASHVVTAEHGGKTRYFCSERCKKAFQATPEVYTPGQSSARRARASRGPA